MKHRTLGDAMKADPSLKEVKKNAEGKNLCRYCNGVVTPPRRSFCSKECVHEWSIRSSTSYARSCARRRDKGICAICKLDTTKLRKELNRLPTAERYVRAAELGIPKHRAYRKSLWDLDHIIPVSEGGGSCGLENLRTLCLPCHRKVTAELRARLAAAKKAADTGNFCSDNCSNNPGEEEKKL